MQPYMKWFGGFLLTAGVSLAGCGNAPVKADDAPAPVEQLEEQTAEAPEQAAISTADSKAIEKLIKADEGKVIVLNFWATWCPPCVAEMPYFIEFYEKMDKESTAFISLSADDPSSYEDVVAKYREEAKINFPIHVLDTREPEMLYDALRTDISGQLPTTIIYNKMGKVVHVWERDTTYEELSKAVKALQ